MLLLGFLLRGIYLSVNVKFMLIHLHGNQYPWIFFPTGFHCSYLSLQLEARDMPRYQITCQETTLHFLQLSPFHKEYKYVDHHQPHVHWWKWKNIYFLTVIINLLWVQKSRNRSVDFFLESLPWIRSQFLLNKLSCHCQGASKISTLKV